MLLCSYVVKKFLPLVTMIITDKWTTVFSRRRCEPWRAWREIQAGGRLVFTTKNPKKASQSTLSDPFVPFVETWCSLCYQIGAVMVVVFSRRRCEPWRALGEIQAADFYDFYDCR